MATLVLVAGAGVVAVVGGRVGAILGLSTTCVLGAGAVVGGRRLLRVVEVDDLGEDAAGADGEAGSASGPAGGALPAWAGTLLEILCGLGVVAVVLWPVSRAPGEQLAGSLDAPYHAWLGWRIAELWRAGDLLTLTIPDAFAPMGLDLRLVDGLLPGWITAGWNLATAGDLVRSYNLALATGLALDLWAGRALARVLTPRRWLAFLAGVAFATAPALLGARNAHLAFVWAFPLPLLVRRAVLVARGGPVAPVRTGLLVALAFLCSAYHLLFGVLAAVIVLLAWPEARWWRREVLVPLGGAAVVAGVLLAPFVMARLAYEADERAAGSTEVVRLAESRAFSADALGPLQVADGRMVELPLPSAGRAEVVAYPTLRPAWIGLALLAGVGLLLVTRTPARRPLLLSAGILWVLGLGVGLTVGGAPMAADSDRVPASWLPFRYVLEVPGLGALRAPTRSSFALAAVLTAALAVGVEALCRRHPGRRSGLITGALLSAALVGTVLAPVGRSDLGVSATTRAGLEEVARRSPASARASLLIVPWGCRMDDPRVIALQSLHRQGNVGCNPPPTATRWYSGLDPWVTSRGLAALRCDPSHIDRRPVPWDDTVRLDASSLAELRAVLGVRFVVVDRGLLPGFGCPSVRDALELLASYDVISDDGTWQIIDLERARPAG